MAKKQGSCFHYLRNDREQLAYKNKQSLKIVSRPCNLTMTKITRSLNTVKYQLAGKIYASSSYSRTNRQSLECENEIKRFY